MDGGVGELAAASTEVAIREGFGAVALFHRVDAEGDESVRFVSDENIQWTYKVVFSS